MLPINKTYFLFTVDMLFYLTFFFISLMFVYLQKLLHCLIIYSYKTNSSFLPCPWNLRSIGPSDFKCVLLCSLFVTGRWKKCNIQFQFMTYVCMQLNIYCLRSAPHIIYRVLLNIEVIFCQQHYFFIKLKLRITIVFCY